MKKKVTIEVAEGYVVIRNVKIEGEIIIYGNGIGGYVVNTSKAELTPINEKRRARVVSGYHDGLQHRQGKDLVEDS